MKEITEMLDKEKETKRKIKDIETLQEKGELEKLVKLILELDLDSDIVSLDFLDYNTKYKNGITLLEYCYYHHHIRILDFVYNT